MWLLVVPVLALLGVLTALQYQQRMADAERELMRRADERAQELEAIARPVMDHVHDLRRAMEDHWADPPDFGPALGRALTMQRLAGGELDGWSLDGAPEAVRAQLGLGSGDAVFFVAGKPATFEAVAGRARTVIGKELGLTEEDRFAFCWIVDFPMYEKDAESGKIDFSHNPFSMPQGGLEALQGDPLEVKGFQYDLACNGYELISGAIRNHKLEIMYKAFELAGYGRDEVERRFGGMVNAFRYGLQGVTDIPLWVAFSIILGFITVLAAISLHLLGRGVGIKT
jgi:hypothetical protein